MNDCSLLFYRKMICLLSLDKLADSLITRLVAHLSHIVASRQSFDRDFCKAAIELNSECGDHLSGIAVDVNLCFLVSLTTHDEFA